MNPDDLMSPGQRSYLTDLAHDVLGNADGDKYLADLRAQHPRPTRQQASAWIDEMKARKDAAPKKSEDRAPLARGGLPTVPPGRYAITGEDGGTYLYKVDRPTEGRFAGYTFVSWVRDNGYESRLPMVHMKRVLAVIAEDPKGALIAYGRRTGACGVCGRKLTDPESVKLGIGPICLSKL